ncbi:GNAT family N-acetyltransferase [Kitasatospora brasiliensis]|uniref:GNAT family N-acetyltransferase n=1 Tax=Kitasatospora brasiliensis TaxID=3058040 RepID=UPI0029302910|nr:GNAT family protein [Kitasatospora sp. K002]
MTTTDTDRRLFRRTVLDLGDALLRPFGPDLDVAGGIGPALLAASADPAVARWSPLGADGPVVPETYLARSDKWWAEGTAATFAIIDAADGSLCGNTYLGWTNRDDGIAMIGYWLLAAARGRGLATRATTAVTRWAAEHAGVRRFELYHAVANGDSCRVAERAGFPYEGTLRGSYTYDGSVYVDEHLHARLASDPFTD